MPLAVALPAAAFGAAAGTIMIALHEPVAVAVAAGAGVAALGAVRVRGRNVWQTLGMRLALHCRRGRGADGAAATEPFDVPVPEAGSYGMRWDGRYLVTMLEVEPRPVAPTLLVPTAIHGADAIPLDEVARCLSQFDIRLNCIDVVAFGVRTRGGHDAVRLYERMLGPLPATAERTVWLALRFDPLDNTEAIDNRGGGTEGTIRTALVATRRVVNRLARHGIRVRVLPAAALSAAESALQHDIEPGRWQEGWHALSCNDIRLSGYAVRPDRLNPDVLAGIWAVPGLSTLVRLRVADGGDGRAAVTALVRHDTVGSVPGELRDRLSELGLWPLTGMQRRVLLDGEQHASAAYGPPAALARLTVPAGGCGQVIGATDDGFGVAVPLFGPTVRRVEIVGSLWLVQQQTLRAMALGAKVIVHSTRPEDWEQLVRQVGVPQALSVSHPGGGAEHTAAATMIVYDGVASTGQVSEATVVRVRAPGEVSGADLDADVVLVEDNEQRDRVHIRTAGGDLTVRMVSIPDELRYLEGAERILQPA
ncbi:type VII secretion protein EccE [Nocardia sp. NEAU-G5]|uniref:Type VII secretion protein EccE n=1 Tax=Nocardia albiluteola TaxID=2842303 RepID=A0ABS6B4G7_9NOCA|nr:type VII secretion protein EccE [Nocardia albiluteola]MBU3065202.1 type VII secretion protein EccE [Nocardia albiluteola]